MARGVASLPALDHPRERPEIVPAPAGPGGIVLVAAGPEIVGGQGTQAHALLDALRRDGLEVAFLPVNPPFPRGLGWLRRRPYARTILNQALYLPSLLRLRRAAVAHVFSAAYWSFLLGPVPAMLAARAFGRRVVLHYHSGEAGDHLARWGILVHPFLRLADVIVVPSPYLQGVFARHGLRVLVIPNVVDTARFRYRDRVPLRPRLLSARNLEPYYRVDTTLRMFALLRERFPEATLVVAGGGGEEARLRALARDLGERGIRFAGRVEPRQMPALYDGADIFVNASIVDNQPVSVLEAFAAGLPVVTTPTGDIATLVREGQTGLLVPPGDPERMAGAVASLVVDPARARAMARRAREVVERYTWAAVKEAWRAAYREIP